jgi:hypothetical protein
MSTFQKCPKSVSQMALQVMCDMGQYFWPGLTKVVESNPKLLTE